MIKDVFLHPLGPSLILALGGLLLLPLRHRRRVLGRDAGRWALPLAFLFAFMAGLLLLALRRGYGGAVGLLHWNWQPLTVSGSGLDWRMDGWNWLAALLLLCVVAAALALQDDPATDSGTTVRASRTLWLGAAALAFVFSDNLVTLASCWVCLDAALALRLLPGMTAQPAGRAWILLSLGGLVLLAALVFAGENAARATLTAGLFPKGVLALLWLAALVRTGAYPLHFWLTSRGRLDASDRVALHLIGPVAGIWLLALVHQLAGPAWFRQPVWAWLGALALLGTALAAWVAPDQAGAWRWITINRASLVVLAAYVAGLAGPVGLVWPLVAFALGPALLALGVAVRARWRWALPAWLGALVVWGLPGTPGFLARSALVLPTNTAGPLSVPLNVLLYGLVLVSEILLVAALWELVTGEETADQPAAGKIVPSAIWRLSATTVLLAVPVIVWGIAPRQPVMLAGLPVASGLPWTLFQALGEARRSIWTGLLAASVGGVALGWLRPQIFAGMRGWQEGVTAVVSLEWLFQGLGLALEFAGGLLQYFARLGEGEGYVGWLALAALLLWMLLRM